MNYAIVLTDEAKLMIKEIGVGIRKQGGKSDIYERLKKLFVHA